MGAIAAGFVFSEYFIGHDRFDFWAGALVTSHGDVMDEAHHIPGWIKWLPTGMMALGFLLSVLFYVVKPGIPKSMAATFPGAYKFLLNKWYFDELYDRIFVRPAFWLGRVLWIRGDQKTIDGFGPDGIAASVLAAAKRIRVLQSGYVYHYAFAMLIGIAIVISYFVLTGGGF
ncbi:hypothetical protein JCM17844_03350 [Iodidimonas gelatinilytica]|uniref:NADH-ubiquinone oxidoreductase chain 5 n=1 Tax=Iodidimonas gelatinilytica TaxID=1236966 RepID=A0A5A7MP18_9PROT|nr:hypothetical protein JCM17844_03350 [Iodidimonas gelatinilytica]